MSSQTRPSRPSRASSTSRARRHLAVGSLVLAFLGLASGCDKPPSAGGARETRETAGATSAAPSPSAGTPATGVSSVGASPGASPAPPGSGSVVATAGKPAIEYLEILSGGAKATDTLPMVVALHGRGDKPESFQEVLAGFDKPARFIVPRGLTPLGNGYSWFALEGGLMAEITGTGILQAADGVAALVKTLAAERPTMGKPIVLGFSQGGALSFALALWHPEVISAAFPVGGWAPPAVLAGKGTSVPIRAMHGEADERVPIGPTREAVAALKARGVQAELKGYPGIGHAVSPEMRLDLAQMVRDALPAAAAPK
ncbi:alpha/beta hydrolase [Chondromyces apiculatus]|uniref:Phospholipase/carboxylesterase/thioesterase domain-containing protein n=1 Tax=Chondromyces apiculatus DSM 436 TaxID=1192034 RepID=A0A017T0F5_9BACT|nr:dienelactone hydrolase family protein [Chondromyces apiculatus]EYF02729.1 Hypothetical protein CAP_6619 [Chondromyces apiculatus DSM 436]